MTKRDIFYRDVALFRTQTVVDRIVDDIAYNDYVPQLTLNVVTPLEKPHIWPCHHHSQKPSIPKGPLCFGLPIFSGKRSKGAKQKEPKSSTQLNNFGQL
ncbi:hypothetical protein DM01DRAFT_1064688 [Hesseltinella vesiculosa]|uniref:Spo11/DNA topoisomerase VI subunit A N-terminal domain-containing protein n=1 Tax=Hesseltinella vesiculosa TaxID=101127 RepID=A0A1X2GEI0_9FUNG|nr:hypothetical protein DM01DRAFT_1064688 [Hesseltinella vesiculosa]